MALVGALLLLAACGSNPEPAPRRTRRSRSVLAARAASRGPARDRNRIWRRPPATACSSPFDSADISPEAQQILERQAEWLRRYPNVSVTIEGHTDERGTREYNLALGERRAQAAKNVLVALGISGRADIDDQLRQGTPRGTGFERAVLRPEPPGVTVVN